MTISSSTTPKEACLLKAIELCSKNLKPPGVQRFVGIGKTSPFSEQWIMSFGILWVLNYGKAAQCPPVAYCLLFPINCEAVTQVQSCFCVTPRLLEFPICV